MDDIGFCHPLRPNRTRRIWSPPIASRPAHRRRRPLSQIIPSLGEEQARRNCQLEYRTWSAANLAPPRMAARFAQERRSSDGRRLPGQRPIQFGECKESNVGRWSKRLRRIFGRKTRRLATNSIGAIVSEMITGFGAIQAHDAHARPSLTGIAQNGDAEGPQSQIRHLKKRAGC